MTLKEACIGMAVVGLDIAGGYRDVIVDIVPSRFNARSRNLRIRLDSGEVFEWHPYYWKPAQERKAKT